MAMAAHLILIVEATGVILEATGQKAEGSTFYPVCVASTMPEPFQNHSRTIEATGVEATGMAAH